MRFNNGTISSGHDIEPILGRFPDFEGMSFDFNFLWGNGSTNLWLVLSSYSRDDHFYVLCGRGGLTSDGSAIVSYLQRPALRESPTF